MLKLPPGVRTRLQFRKSQDNFALLDNRMASQPVNLAMDLWAEEDLDMQPTQLLQS